ncbi:MAG: DegT/DnrJ/EryC1/StrS family aminotransferase [Chloroflexota bacterium]|nr:DegT/DnrJ/EryC1/StrS family aminotransferase [Chloroflexota bacterium]
MPTPWKVPYIDYPTAFRKMEGEIMETIRQVLAGGDLILRKHVEAFEAHLAQFVGTRYAIGVNSGTDALHLSLRAAGIGPGDEVITVSHTFVATAAAIHHAGATPVLVDIGDDHNMDVGKVERAITPRTKAIIPVHLNGRLCAMDALMAIAQRHNLLVIEDAAQALGASYKGRKAGSFGIAGCFSFYPAKILGAFGDAGAVVTNDPQIAQKVRWLRNHGRTEDGDVALFSFNSRLDNLHAAILDLKLKWVPEWIRRRREIARLYHQRLADLPQVHLPPPPVEEGPFFDVFQNYEIEAERRDALVEHLKAQGIEVMLPWGGKAVHHFKALGLSHYALPKTDAVFRRVLMLPMHPELTDQQVEYVAQSIRAFYGR